MYAWAGRRAAYGKGAADAIEHCARTVARAMKEMAKRMVKGSDNKG